MDAYMYRAGATSHALLLEEFEAHMSSALPPCADTGSGVFVVHEGGIVRTVERTVLADNVRLLWGAFASQGELIQYSYGLTFEGCVPSRSAGGMSCSFNGEHAIVESGPGFCHIVATDLIPYTEEEILAAAQKHGVDRSRLQHLQHARRRVLRDLRNMQPAPLDGTNGGPPGVRATRRRKPTLIVQKLAELLAFLESANAPTVDVWFVRRYKRPAEGT